MYIHTRFFSQIREYPNTGILAAALKHWSIWLHIICHTVTQCLTHYAIELLHINTCEK